jgi:hypothetical protein
MMWCIRADRGAHPNIITKYRAGYVVHMEPLCGAPGAHYVVRFGGGAAPQSYCGAILIRVGRPPPRVEKEICRVCGQPVSYVERRRRGGRVYLYGVHRSWVGGRRRIVKHYLGIEEGSGVEAREAPDEGRKPLEERVRELEARGGVCRLHTRGGAGLGVHQGRAPRDPREDGDGRGLRDIH